MVLSNIKKIAESKRITIVSVAEEIGMSIANLHRCIRENKIEASVLEKIAHVLDVPMNVFFDDSKNTITQNGGKKNAASIYGNVSTCDIESYKVKISNLEKLLEEKEKQIKLLNTICEIQKK